MHWRAPCPILPTMPTEPDPPQGEPDPPKEWRVYEGDDTPDPESPTPPEPPYGAAPPVPSGQPQPAYAPVTVRVSSGATTKIIMIVIAVAVLGGGIAAAIAIFAAVGGVDGITGVDPKKSEDFAKMVDAIEEKTGSSQVFSVGLYDGYAIVYVPVNKTGDSAIAYDWRGGDNLDVFTKTTSSDQRFSLDEIDPDVIDGMCDPVLRLADGATPGDCYVFIGKPDPEYGNGVWFSAGASDEYGHDFSVTYDKSGQEVSRTTPAP